MLKFISSRVVLAVCLLLALAAIHSQAKADSISGWISQSPILTKQADTQSSPSSLNGNIDCQLESQFNCSVPTTYGSATQNNTVRFSGTPDFNPVYSYIENRQRFLPIPNSSTAITYTTEPSYGFYLYFNYNLAASVTKSGGFPSLDPLTYHINKPPDGKLADKTNHRLAADYGSFSFSQNGQWMVVSSPNLSMLRVNLQTFEVLPFAAGADYSIGKDPAFKTAITNDGRYAVVASQSFSIFKIYDLSTCAAVPSTISGPVACQSRDLLSYANQQIPGFKLVGSARFLDDDNLAIYATASLNNIGSTARYIISPSATSSGIQYLALGDSYISGEGAFDYQGGTDTDSNKCHISLVGYPYLIGHDLNYDSYHSVACSGATTDDILNSSQDYRGQADSKKIKRSGRSAEFISSVFDSFTPGYVNQLDFVSQYQPKVTTVSIGGNDMGFSDKLKSCVAVSISGNTCYSTYEDRYELIGQINNVVYPRLLNTYRQIKNVSPPDTKIYAIGYPQIAKPGGDCALNVRLNSDEVLLSQQLIKYLDSVVKAAADKTGVYYVDTQNALDGHRLCEAGPGSTAVNGVTAGNDRPDKLGGPIGDESYHPNAFGYQLLENSILASTDNLTAPMPAPDTSAGLPDQTNLDILNAPRSGRAIKTTEFDPGISQDLAYKGTSVDISIDGEPHLLPANTTLQAELHSAPISLGNFKTDPSGNLSAQILIPADTPPGYHTLHFYGTDVAGQAIDIYKDIYIAGSANDIDGNGVLDIAEPCIGVPASGQDFDQDGIDDACDGDITQPPVSPTRGQALAGSTTSNKVEILSSGLNQSGPSGSTTDFSNDPVQAAAPVVQSASTTAKSEETPAPPSQPQPALDQTKISSMPSWYWAAGGLGILVTASLAYLAKGRLG